MAVLLPAVLAAAAGAGDGEPPAERRSELLYRLEQDCGSCHGLTLKGGLGPPLRPADLRDRAAEALADVIRHGVPGTPMPPWAFEISHDEALWLARRLKEGTADGR